MRRLLPLPILFLWLASVVAAQAPRILWQDRFPWPIHWVAVADSGVILVGSDHGSFVQAYEGRRGSRLWQRSARAGLWSPPALRGSVAFLSPHDQSILSLRLDTGDVLWRAGLGVAGPLTRLPGSAPPLNRAPPVPLVEEVAVVSLEGQVSILDASGRVVRRTDLQPGRFHPERFWATPAALDGILYVASTRGNLWRIQIHDLEQRQLLPLKVSSDHGLGDAAREVRAPILALRNRILVATMDGTLHAFEPRPGRMTPLWSTPLGPPGVYHSSRRGLALAAPLPDPLESQVYLSLRDRVVAVHTETGRVAWESLLEDRVETRPARWRDQLLVGLRGGRLLALERATGAIAWSLDLPGSPSAGPVIWGDQLVLGFTDGMVRCYDLASSPPPSPSPQASSTSAAMRIPR